MEKNASILVVDDDKEIADLVEIYLVNDGYQVLKASDGEQCLQTLKNIQKSVCSFYSIL